MASPLISLPRELRNIIYQHLDRQITLKWKTSVVDWEGITSGGQIQAVHEIFEVCFENLSSVGILRAHSQLHDEYKDEECLQNVSVTIDTDLCARRATLYNEGEAPDLNLSPQCTARLRATSSLVFATSSFS
jgi:hypothetical protein